jgi:hypothetical protein
MRNYLIVILSKAKDLTSSASHKILRFAQDDSRYALALLFILFATTALAKPASIEPAIKAEAPIGQGTYSKFLLTIYDATLWTDAPQWSMNKPFALSLTYHIKVNKDDLIDTTIDEMRHVAPLSDDKETQYRAEFEKIYPILKKGDTLTALYVPKKGMQLYLNDKLYSTATDIEFITHFYAIWLSPETSAPELRQQLLGQKS